MIRGTDLSGCQASAPRTKILSGVSRLARSPTFSLILRQLVVIVPCCCSESLPWKIETRTGSQLTTKLHA